MTIPKMTQQTPEYLYQVSGDALASLQSLSQQEAAANGTTVSLEKSHGGNTSNNNNNASKSKKKASKRGTRPPPSSSTTSNNHHNHRPASPEGLVTSPHGHNMSLLTYLTTTAAAASTSHTESTPSYPQLLQHAYSNSYSLSSSNRTEMEKEPLVVLDGTQLVLGHNLALRHLIQNDAPQAKCVLLPLFQRFAPVLQECSFDVTKATNAEPTTNTAKDEGSSASGALGAMSLYLGDLTVQISFLLLDCILAMGPLSSEDGTLAKDVFAYVEAHMKHFSTQSNTTHHQPLPGMSPTSPAVELKFRLSCYKSKILLSPSSATSSASSQKEMDKNIRLAKKELKSAMETYHHKLDPVSQGGGGSAVVGSNRKKSGGGAASVSRADDSTLSVGSVSQEEGGGGAHTGVSSGGLGENSSGAGGSTMGRIQGGPGSNVLNNTSSVAGGSGHDGTTPRTLNFQKRRLQGQHQNALYLKAKLEYLKGNTDKALRLCQEAQNSSLGSTSAYPTFSGTRGVRSTSIEEVEVEGGDLTQVEKVDSNGSIASVMKDLDTEVSNMADLQAALYYNNMAIIYQTEGKVHLATHFYAIAIDHLAKMETNESRPCDSTMDGGALLTQITTSQILFNAAICAQQGAYYKVGYELMARCVSSSQLFAEDSQCWLHMAESCIGIHSESRNQVVGDQQHIDKSPAFGSPEDFDLVSSHPLLRGVDCLTQCLRFLKKYDDKEVSTMIPEKMKHLAILESARVSLAYIWLEMNNLNAVLGISELVLKERTIYAYSDGDNGMEENVSECPASRRRRSTMQMYASEAMQKLGIFSGEEAHRLKNILPVA